MRTNDSKESRVETITAALVYLMTHYARTGAWCGCGPQEQPLH